MTHTAPLGSPNTPYRVVFLGQSANDWPPYYIETWPDFDDSIPDLATRCCRPLTETSWARVSVDGAGWYALMANDQWKAHAAAQPAVMSAETVTIGVMNGGHTDTSGFTAQECYDLLVTTCTYLRSVGYDLLLGVTLVYANGWDSAKLDAVNELILADAAGALDGIARPDLVLTDPYDLTQRQSDFQHPNDHGADLFAEALRGPLRDLMS